MLEQITSRITQFTNQAGAGIYEEDVARHFGVHPSVVERDPSYIEEYQKTMAQKAKSRKRKGKSKGIMSRLFGKSSPKTAKKGRISSMRSPRSRVSPSALDKLEYESPLSSSSSPKRSVSASRHSARKSMRGKGKRRKTRHRRRKSRRRSVRSHSKRR